MTRDVLSIPKDTPVGQIARLLEKKRIKRVPVLRDGRVVGIVSRANPLHALAAVDAAVLQQPTPDDRDLRVRIDEALNEVPGASVNLVNYTVEAGNVSVWGVVDSDFVEKAVRVAVEDVPGVRSVDVQMGRPPPVPIASPWSASTSGIRGRRGASCWRCGGCWRSSAIPRW